MSSLRAAFRWPIALLLSSLFFIAPTFRALAEPITTGPVPAAVWMQDNLDAAEGDPSLLIDVALGMIAAGQHDQADPIREQVLAQAAELDPAVIAKLIVLVRIGGEDPTTAGDVDLVQLLADGTSVDGQVGEYASAFGQSWAILAHNWIGEDVPQPVLDTLLGFVDPEGSGAFGFDDGSGFTADVDSTAMAVMALSGAGNAPSEVQSEAIDWLESQQAEDGSFPGYAQVNSTGLAAGALGDLGRDIGSAQEWLESQQDSDGGLPAESDGPSDLRATSQGVLGLAGVGYATLGASRGSDLGGEVSTSDMESAEGVGFSPALVVGIAVAIGASVLTAGFLLTRRPKSGYAEDPDAEGPAGAAAPSEADHRKGTQAPSGEPEDGPSEDRPH
ncbi:prenyltransferase/squalene oxidase repeat-containing protein [Naumannella halotolerans]|uniref:Prenyltransferase/squalene oxidase-like repeat protein n=1 Tax=Naumannella halotolerans TaxID=993414 RepID=A0A4R7J9N2_9ACTN|nr:prenyltransferase/squalene oxidase repeat-containing protein [Naumannella halotolerans]TDT34252.1 prenyltransferase/squalene oxidase-like repeat protein [Naumannella halotolerans]